MKKTRYALIAFVCAVGSAAAQEVAYPKNYRQWTHVKSMVIEEGHPLFASFGGLHHIYADAKALEGYRSGKFPDGARIVFDLLAVKKEGHAIIEGPRKVLGVMEKNSRKFKDTGGWGFEGFASGEPDKRAVGAKAKEACYGCHAEQAGQNDLVFSAWRD